MINQKRTYFECIIPERNRRAFYELIAGEDLLGYILIRRWGRIGSKGRPKRQRFLRREAMLQEYERIHKERIKHEYVPVYKKAQGRAVADHNPNSFLEYGDAFSRNSFEDQV